MAAGSMVGMVSAGVEFMVFLDEEFVVFEHVSFDCAQVVWGDASITGQTDRC